MPLPIQSLNNWNDDNNDKVSMETLGLSDIQLMLLGGSSNVREAKVTVSQRHIDLLKLIEQNQDEIVTAANVVNNIRDAKTFFVPKNIDDNSLLALKTAGLISGHGRSVTLTERGRVALRDAYLKDPVNEFRKARKKDKFDLNAAKEVKIAELPEGTKLLCGARSNTKMNTFKPFCDVEKENFDVVEWDPCCVFQEDRHNLCRVYEVSGSYCDESAGDDCSGLSKSDKMSLSINFDKLLLIFWHFIF